jgi:DNA-binding CsgD family transcriptional regulator
VRKMVSALFAATNYRGGHLVLPIWKGAKLVALLGWAGAPDPALTKALAHSSSDLRRCFLTAYELEKARRDAHCLRWLLARADRPIAVAAPDGELLGTSLSATNLFQEMRFGARHFLRSDTPELPLPVARSMIKTGAGQVRLGGKCTARFERLEPSPASWLPTVKIECFVEPSTQTGLPLSRLTAVERDIYCQIAAGATNAEIARRRGTAFSTVKNQISHLLDKLGVSRRIELLSPPSGLQFLQANSAREGGSMAVTR